MAQGVTESEICHHGHVSEVDQGRNVLSRPAHTAEQNPTQVGPDLIPTSSDRRRDFDAFYRSHRSEIARALAFTLGSTSLAEEAVDEAMARAYQRWTELSQYDNPAGWVYRAGLNWAKSWKRSAFRRARREEKAARQAALHSTENTSTAEATDELFAALNKLSINQRSVVVLRHYCDWSVSETADALGISEGTVKSRSARGLSHLRDVLDGGES